MPELLTVEDLSNYLRCSVDTVYGLTRSRQKNALPSIQIGKQRYFLKTSVEAWLAARESR